MALISYIATELSSSSKARQVITLAADIFTRKYLNISYEHIVDHFESNSRTVKNFSDELKQAISEKIGTTKLVVLLDDLDRCDVENVLTILSMMKLFLDQDNCICVAAVDFKRLEHAWKKNMDF